MSTYFAVLVACTLHQCYRMGIYSQRPFATREACVATFSYVATGLSPSKLFPLEPTLHVLCMTPDEWKQLPEYRRRTTR